MPHSDLDILTVSETWLSPNVEDRLTTIKGYSLIRHDRQTLTVKGTIKKGGGLGFYYKQTLDVDPDKFKHLNVSNASLEVQWVVVSRSHTKKILVANVYRPPDGKVTEAFDKLDEALDQIADLNKYETLMIGDFNTDGANKKGQHYKLIKKFEAEQQLQQMITEPTRYSKKAHTTIDLAFTNIKYCTGSGVINYNISDHKLIYVIKKKPRNCKAITTHMGRSYAKYTKEALKKALNQIDTSHIFEITDPNQCWTELEKIITAAADKVCPIKELKIRIETVKYLNSRLLELQKDRDYFVGKADLSGEPGDRFISNCLVKQAKSEIDKARANHYKELADEHDQNDTKFWSDVEDTEPLANAKINGLIDEQTGEKIPESKMPEKVNKFFTGIGEKLAKKFTDVREENKKFIPKTNEIKFDIGTIRKSDVKTKLKEISKKKASGMTNLSSEMVVDSIEILIDHFTHLYNYAMEQGVFPDSWKIATVTPIPKIAQPKTCGDLRPISILPLPGRILEKIIGSGITDHLEKTGYLPDQQNGFRRGRSTTKSVASLLDELLQGIDKGHIAITIFLDFKKAFDTVDHKILLWKLRKAGIGPKLCKLLANYLTNRKQRTKINGITSTCLDVKTGVPQGSTLGPLLFIIFTSDLPQITKLLFFTMFADDTTCTIIGKYLKEAAEIVNGVMPLLTTWCEENKLTLNVIKTEYMVFGTKAKLSAEGEIEIKLGDQNLRRVDSYKYLGTTLDPTLNATKQLSKLNQKLACKLISFRKIRSCMSEHTAIIIFKATIVPIFDYNDLFYNLLTQQQLVKMQRLQNRALRLVFRGKILSVREMHEKANVDYLEQRREMHMLALMFSRTLDPYYRDDTCRVTRRAEAVMLKVPRKKTNKFGKSPICWGSSLWNGLPVRVRQAKSKLALKNLTKLHRAGQPLEWMEGVEEQQPNGSTRIIDD